MRDIVAKFYQVGGAVRDEVLGLKAKDVDYAVEAESYDHMLWAIHAREGEIFLETPQFYTVRAKVPGMGACDFVLCRKEADYRDGRRPESVSVGTIYDDLARRDFTVNAMAKGEDGVLLDPHGGWNDLQARRLRCVGDTKARFTEDGLRMLRAIRFAITKGFWLDDEIVKCLSDSEWFEPKFAGVSKERIREELFKCFSCSTLATLRLLDKFSALRELLFCNCSECGKLWLKPTLEGR